MTEPLPSEAIELLIKYRLFVQQVAQLVVPGDQDPTMARRVEEAMECDATYNCDGRPASPDDAVLDFAGDDGFFESELLALWALVRKARSVLNG